MKSFRTFLKENQRKHNYHLKIATSLDEKILEKIEQYLDKYELLDITPAKKRLLSDFKNVFPNVDAFEIHLLDFTTRYPASPSVMMEELAKTLGISSSYLKISTPNSPLETHDMTNGDNQDIFKNQGHTTEQELANSEIGKHIAGNAYTDDYLAFLSKLSDSRRKNQKVDLDNPLNVQGYTTQWEKNYNAETGTPVAHPRGTVKKKTMYEKLQEIILPSGAFSDKSRGIK